MTSYTLPITIGRQTNDFGYVKWLRKLAKPTISFVGNKGETISILLTNQYFLKEVDKAREDFIKNKNNFRKYPRLDEED